MKPFVIVLFVVAQSAFAVDFIYPGTDWQKVPPAQVGMSDAKIKSAVAYLKSKMNADDTAVIRNGYLVYSGSKSKTRYGVWSCTKSFTSTTLGVMIDQGKVTLDTFAADHSPVLKSKYAKIQLKHFTTMTSGYDANGGSYGYKNLDGSGTPQNPAAPSFAPGSYFAYWDDAMNMFGITLGRAAGQNFSNLFKSEIATPIGINNFSWKTTFNYEGKSYSTGAGSGGGVNVSAEEMARFCYLMLRKGNWAGKQLVSEAWVEQATRTVQVPSSMKVNAKTQAWIANGHYGYNWWINAAKGEKKLWSGLPESAFAARGTRGNFCVVVPEWDLVAVRVGGEGTNSHEVLDGFVSKLMN